MANIRYLQLLKGFEKSEINRGINNNGPKPFLKPAGLNLHTAITKAIKPNHPHSDNNDANAFGEDISPYFLTI